MGVVRLSGTCPLAVRFIVNPDCSRDDHTPYEDLEIRWDFNADGTWDTVYGPLKNQWDAGPSSVSATIWRVRCEVRDHRGQTSERVDSLDLRPLLPRPPDIIAGKIEVTLEGSMCDLDTVSVGEPFCLWIFKRCWMEPTEELYLTQWRLDGELFFEYWAHVSPPPLDACSGHGRCRLTIDQAGTYHIQVSLDATNAVLETDETNNVAGRSLVVVEAPRNQ
jgi:hypothetical protein